MQTSAQGEAAIIHEEGEVLRAYRDVVGVWTIGIGLTAASGVVQPKAGMVITRAESRSLLQKTLRRNYEPAVARAMPGGKQHEFDAGVGFHFNTGAIGRASWVTAWRTKAGRADITRRLAMWNKGGGKVLPGLVKRRAREVAMLLDGKYPVASPTAGQGAIVTSRGSSYVAATWAVPMEHAEAMEVQEALRTIGFDAGNIAAVIPSETIRAFQAKHGLTIDGIIGRATLSTLQRMLNARANAVPAIGAPVVAGSSAVSGADQVMTGVPYAGEIALGLGLLFTVYTAFKYRDAIAAAAHERFPNLAAKLRSF